MAQNSPLRPLCVHLELWLFCMISFSNLRLCLTGIASLGPLVVTCTSSTTFTVVACRAVAFWCIVLTALVDVKTLKIISFE